ncbi:hypothetical protein [Desulfolutivibrio sulfodismutans]|nr:hypothetical protein [Desulfolutivibrio sulfodismutans]
MAQLFRVAISVVEILIDTGKAIWSKFHKAVSATSPESPFC